MLQRLGKAFLVGAIAGLAGEITLSLTLLFLPPGMAATMISVILFGLIALALIASGLFNKIAAFGGPGASICLCGLMYGAGMGYAVSKKTGDSFLTAFFKGLWGTLKIMGTGFVIAFLFGLLLH